MGVAAGGLAARVAASSLCCGGGLCSFPIRVGCVPGMPSTRSCPPELRGEDQLMGHPCGEDHTVVRVYDEIEVKSSQQPLIVIDSSSEDEVVVLDSSTSEDEVVVLPIPAVSRVKSSQ